MNSIEKHIRCQTEMKDKKEKKVKVIPSVDYNEWKKKYGLKPSKSKMKKSKMKVKRNLNL